MIIWRLIRMHYDRLIACGRWMAYDRLMGRDRRMCFYRLFLRRRPVVGSFRRMGWSSVISMRYISVSKTWIMDWLGLMIGSRMFGLMGARNWLLLTRYLGL